MVVCGTRPEAIKMSPLVVELMKTEGVETKLCSTGQHKEMLDHVFSLFNLAPDFNMEVMKESQDLTDVTSKILQGLRTIFAKYRPDRILVHGDTNTTISSALAAYYAKIPVSHIEAGLRTFDIYSPWPEEGNRQITSIIADKHYAPTEWARKNLLRESVQDSRILVTGNTVIDALLMVVNRLNDDKEFREDVANKFSFLDFSKKIILVTGHRRENFGDGFINICKALSILAKRKDVQIVYPVHLNPNVQKPVSELLGKLPSVNLIEPQDYLPFVYLMSRCHHIISDSGGIQEEAPSLGKPVLVMRNSTERPEALEAGTVKLVGTSSDVIVKESTLLMDNEDHYQQMSVANNPYGDGRASQIICRDIIR